LIAAGTEDRVRDVQARIGQRFQVRHMGTPSYFLGMNVLYLREQRKLHLSQQSYVEALMGQYEEYVKGPRTLPMGVGIELNREQGVVDPTMLPYASLVGSLLYLAVCTRPDVSFAVGTLSKFISAPGSEHWRAAIDTLSYLGASRKLGIMLGEVDNGVKQGIMCYADSDWANDQDDRRSVTGSAVFVDGSLVAWISRKQNLVCTSTAEAEIHAIMELLNVQRGVGNVLVELNGIFSDEDFGMPVIFSDNQPGLDAIKSRKAKRKHYDVKVKHLAEAIDTREFKLQKIATSENIADVFTKPLRSVRFRYLTGVFMTKV
jgi:hypothetical protein